MTVYLGTETTGLSSARGDAIVEVAIVDGEGRVLIDTLLNPGRSSVQCCGLRMCAASGGGN
jgi:hypothetical protein